MEAAEAAELGAERLGRSAARGLGLTAGRGAAGPLLRAFLAGAAGPVLLAWRGPGGELELGPPPPPAAARPKAVFFLRAPGAGPGELLCGDLPADALRHFAALVEEVRAGRPRGCDPGRSASGEPRH